LPSALPTQHGTVYPAAGFVEEAKSVGAYCIEVNLESSEIHSHFDKIELGKATELVPRLVELLLTSNTLV